MEKKRVLILVVFILLLNTGCLAGTPEDNSSDVAREFVEAFFNIPVGMDYYTWHENVCPHVSMVDPGIFYDLCQETEEAVTAWEYMASQAPISIQVHSVTLMQEYSRDYTDVETAEIKKATGIDGVSGARAYEIQCTLSVEGEMTMVLYMTGVNGQWKVWDLDT